MLTSSSIVFLLEGLERCRRMLALALVLLLGLAILFYLHAETLFTWVARHAASHELHYFSPIEGWVVRVKLALVAAALTSFPVFLFFFLRPAGRLWPFLFSAWKRALLVAVFSSLFGAGLAFGWLFVVPASTRFLLSAGEGFLVPMLSADDFVTFVLVLLTFCGAAFELPLIMLLLSRVGVVSAAALRRSRRMVILSVVIIVAVLTPTPDAATLLLLSAPLLALFELGVAVVSVCERWGAR